ncbi:MAG: hypothetical protein ACRESZ_14835 [Methylococcales bacterium]
MIKAKTGRHNEGNTGECLNILRIERLIQFQSAINLSKPTHLLAADAKG